MDRDKLWQKQPAEVRSPQERALHKQFHQERLKAMERIRTTPDGAVGWVLRFLQTDLEALTPTEWTLWAFEVACFVEGVTDRYGGIIATESGLSVHGVPNGSDH